MPLLTGKKNIGKNIRELKRVGRKTQKQAVAIALEAAGKAGKAVKRVGKNIRREMKKSERKVERIERRGKK